MAISDPSVGAHEAANDWFRAFVLTLVTLAVPWIVPGALGFGLLLLIYGTPYSVVHSIWVHRLEWVGDPDNFAGGIALALLFYTVIFGSLFRIRRTMSSRVRSRASG